MIRRVCNNSFGKKSNVHSAPLSMVLRSPLISNAIGSVLSLPGWIFLRSIIYTFNNLAYLVREYNGLKTNIIILSV